MRQDQAEFKDTVAISAEVGYRIGHWVGRAGLIENSGGAGIDYLTLKDRLRFSAEVWNFSDEDGLNPHAKLTGRYYFTPSIFLTGGWDDLLNTKANRDSFFVGAGIRWGDDDMKYLAGSIPHAVEQKDAMARAVTLFACQSCGATAPKWLGRCPECGDWNSYVEEAREKPAPAAAVAGRRPRRSRSETSTPLEGPRLRDGACRASTACSAAASFRARSSCSGASPGSASRRCSSRPGAELASGGGRDVLYASAEESAAQVRLRGGAPRDPRRAPPGARRDRRLPHRGGGRGPSARGRRRRLGAGRSRARRSPRPPGTVSQVRAAAAELTRYAKSRGVPVLLVGHVTKDGNLAGPKSLEHLVDAVVSIEGDRGGSRRLLRATKNRFGPVDEIALYEMTGEGLAELPDASAALLAERRAGLPGSAVTAAREGTRSVLVEIQALVGGRSRPDRRGGSRSALDGGRLALLLAVLEGAGLALSSREVFVSCTGGIEVTEPAADLAIVAALASSARVDAPSRPERVLRRNRPARRRCGGCRRPRRA